jgi:D-serine deaminase-like pyridoxal phosphate-dependent protein
MIEVEAGCLRSGVAPSDCGELARTAQRLGCRVAGLFSYPGQSYIPDQAKDASEQELAALESGASELRRAGFDPEHISAGSTPTMRFARAGIATEYRPGTYVFGDRQQLGLGAMERSGLSLTVVATVVAIHDDRLVLDAGGKALGRDAPRWLPGYGQLADSSEALITRLYDHHAVVESYRGQAVRVGDRLSILPNNANSVMALLRSAWLSEAGESAVELTPQADR